MSSGLVFKYFLLYRSPDGKWSPLLMDFCNTIDDADALPTIQVDVNPPFAGPPLNTNIERVYTKGVVSIYQ